MPGHANTVAFALDRLEIEEIAGTIAGDDTILLILAEGIAPSDLHKSMTSMVPNWEEYL
jgi:transcriptional regulator of arginine metabolism